MWEIIRQIFPYAIAFTIPLLITALGGLFSERSGVVNIGLEGLMVVGFFAAALTIYKLEPVMSNAVLRVILGLLAAVIAGVIFSLLHAVASIHMKANQVISGTAINMMAGAVTVYLARNITGSGNIHIEAGVPRKDVSFLGLVKIPVLGPLFFRQTYFTTWIVIAILLASWFILYKTSFGLRLRACGEHPHAAESAGINVYRMRYFGVLVSGAFAALGGAIIMVTYSGEFSGTVSGLGFLALAALIFGQWKPLGVLGASFFFGFASTIANVSQAVPALMAIPPTLLKTFPYIVTLVALVLFSKSSQAPKASGIPF